MAFLVLLITLGCYKFLGWRVDRRFDEWFFLLSDSLGSTFQKHPQVATLLTLLLPVLLAGLLLNLLENSLFGFIGVALQVLLLFYSMGRDNLLQCTEGYLRRWRAGDTQAAYHFASEYLKTQEDIDVNDLASLQREVRTGLLYQWFEQVFLVLFWYLLAGPLAALFIRFICLYDQWLKASDDTAAAAMPLQILHALEWLPARCVGLTFTLAGNFVLCFRSWIDAVLSWHTPTEKVLYNTGMAALGACVETSEDMIRPVERIADVSDEYTQEIQAIQDLLVRSLIVWVVIVALIVIF